MIQTKMQENKQEARPQKDEKRAENNQGYESPVLIRVDYETGPDGGVLVPENKTLEEIL